MRYYFTIGSKALPTCIYTHDDDKIDKRDFKFCVEIDRVSTIVFTREFKKYIEECIKNREPNAFDMTPYVVPYDYIKPDGNLDVVSFDNDVKTGRLILKDNLLYQIPNVGKN